MKARKALLHAKDYFLVTINHQAVRVHTGDDPATLLLTLAVHNDDFYDTIKAIIDQADQIREAEGESE